MIHHWKGLDLEISDFIYDSTFLGEITPSQTSRPQGMLYVDIILLLETESKRQAR